MARQKKSDVEKKKKQSVVYDFSDFIKTDLHDIISKHIDTIKRICTEYEGICEMSDECWKTILDIVIEVQRHERCDRDKSMLLGTVKRTKYSITEKVWEMQRKKYILTWCERYERAKSENDERGMYYSTYLLYLQMEILIKETKVIKKEKETKKKSTEIQEK